MMLGRNIFGRGLIYAAVAGMLLGSVPAAAQTLEKPQFQEATEETQELFEEIFAKNSAKGILQGLKSLMTRTVYYKDGKSIGKFYVYGDPDNFIYEVSTGESLLVTPSLYLTMDHGKMLEYLLMPDEYEDIFQDYFKSFGLSIAEGEKVVEYAEDDDHIYLVSETSDEKTVKELLEQANNFQEDAYTYEEGQTLRYSVTFDQDTQKFQYGETYLVDKDGTKELLYRCDFVFDDVMDVENSSSFAKYFAGESRNIIIVTNAGTEEEVSYGYTIPRGVSFDVCFDGEYPEVYTDKECTKPFKFSSSDQQNDCYLYIKGNATSRSDDGKGM